MRISLIALGSARQVNEHVGIIETAGYIGVFIL